MKPKSKSSKLWMTIAGGTISVVLAALASAYPRYQPLIYAIPAVLAQFGIYVAIEGHIDGQAAKSPTTTTTAADGGNVQINQSAPPNGGA